MASTGTQISFLGFGEAGQAFSTGLQQGGAPLTIRAFDIKTLGEHAEEKRADYQKCGVEEAPSMDDLCSNTTAIFSLVTADQVEAAAQEAAKTALNGAFYFDCNSCAPKSKQNAASIIEEAGGRYIDVAVMTPVHPKLHKAPCLIAGPHATEAKGLMDTLGMVAKIAGPHVGDASVRKMVRSVMVKGLEALTLECFLAARQAGIDDDILKSLDTSYDGFGWYERGAYMMERAITHGTRRAAEMEESVKTLRDLGIAPHITEATVLRQRQVGALGLKAEEIGPENISALAYAILNGIDTNSSS